MDLIGYYSSVFQDKDDAQYLLHSFIIGARSQNSFEDGNLYYIFDGDIIDN